MKRKILSILFAVVLMLSFGLVTALPAGAHDPISLSNKGTGVASWSTDFGHDDSTSAHLVTGLKEGSGDEARIVIDMEGYTLGDIEAISWYEYLEVGYPPHVDIVLDTTDQLQSVLTAEMAYNNAEGIELDEGLGDNLTAIYGEWLQTFELASGDGFGQVDDSTMLWVAGMGAGNEDAPSGTLGQWKISKVGSDPMNELLTTEISADTPVLRLEIEVDNWVLETEAFVDDVAINGMVLDMGVDPMASYEMHFEGALVEVGEEGSGIYSGMIPMIKAGGSNVYARNGASAWFGNDPDNGGALPPVWDEVIISNHDPFPGDDPDTPDWYQYSLRFYEEGGVQKWRIANHSGATVEYPWYHSHWAGEKLGEQGVPMSGFMDWDNAYAFETDVGVYHEPLDVNHGEIPGGAEARGGGAACWDMDWSWGSEVVPLQYPGFTVTITGSGPYSVTLTPAPHDVINTADKIIGLNDGWTIISSDRISNINLVNSEIEYAYSGGFGSPSLDEVSPLTPIFVKTIGGGIASFVVDDSSQGLYSLDLDAGWNLIGIPKTVATPSAILSPLRFTATGDVALATLASQGGYNQNTSSFYKATLTDGDWVSFPELSPLDGYWAYMNAPKDFGVVAVK